MGPNIMDVFKSLKGYKCPVCDDYTLKIIYDDDSNGGMDRLVCDNPDCNWSG